MRKYAILIFLVFSLIKLDARVYNYKYFNTTNSLPSDYIYDVTQDSIGKLWFATSEGVVRFQNQKFEVFKSQSDSLPNVFLNIMIYQDAIWACGKNGQLLKVKNGLTKSFDLNTTSRLIKILSLEDNLFLVVSQNDGLYLFDTELEKVVQKYTYDQFELGYVTNIVSVGDEYLLCSDLGIHAISFDKTTLAKKWTYFDLGGVNATIAVSENKILIGTEYAGLYVADLREGVKKAQRIFEEHFSEDVLIKNFRKDMDGNFWISTHGKGAYLLTPELKDIDIFFSSAIGDFKYVNNVFEDYEGNYWFATYGKGLFVLSDHFFAYTTKNDVVTQKISAIIEVDTGVIYSDHNVVRLFDDHNELHEIVTIEEAKITSMSKKEELLFIGTASSGLYIYDTKTKKLSQIDFDDNQLSKKINHIAIIDNQLWISTYNGLFVINIFSNKIKHYDTSNGLRHNLVNSVYQSRDGDVYIGSKNNRIFRINQAQEEEEIKLPNSNINISISCFEQVNNKLLIGTVGSGLYVKDHDTIYNLEENDGLHSNYIYSILNYDNENIFIVHVNRITHYNLRTKVAVILENTFDISNEFEVRSVLSDESGSFFIGANTGLIKFNPKEYLSSRIVPRFGFNSIKVNDTIYRTDQTKIEIPYGRNKILLDYKGESFNHGDLIKYYYRLTAEDDDWHDGQTSYYANFSNLPPGQYSFLIKACYLGTCYEKESSFTFVVLAPIWDRAWFRLLIFALLVITVYVIFVWQRRSERIKKKVLEYNIELKTKEIKLKTEHIVASITYAKMIQNAVIPVLKNLSPSTIDFFCLNYPKDIVGGDFTWCHKASNGYVYYALCDCTGHGVPGGFMTILSQNAINNVMRTQDSVFPHMLLESIDTRIVNQLSKDEEYSVNDGLDAGVLMFDFEKSVIYYSAARRPLLYIDKNDKLQIVKGTRRSIGDKQSKYKFELHELSFDNVKYLYLFSDGYTDQFGGERETKFSSKRLYKLLEENKYQDIYSQKISIEKAFLEWKGNMNDQTDDMSFIGINLK